MRRLKLLINISWKISAKYYILLLLFSLISGMSMLLNTYFPALIVEIISVKGIEQGVLLRCALILTASMLLKLFENYMQSRLELENIYLTDMMSFKLSEKVMSINFSKLESPYYLDLQQKAMYSVEIQRAYTTFLAKITNVVKNVFLLAELVGFMVLFSSFLIITIVLFSTVVFLLCIWFKKYEERFSEQFAVASRKFSYYLNLCFDDTLQKDIRLYDMALLLTGKVRSENRIIAEKQQRYCNRRGKHNGAIFVITLVQNAIVYLYIIKRTFWGTSAERLTYGELTFYLTAATNLFHVMKELISDLIIMLQMLTYLEPYIEFITLEDDVKEYGIEKLSEPITSLEFKNVSFVYPGTKKEVLSDVSFKIKAREKISIVGINGSGKTTIVKLICRLYKPTGGTIYINNKDIWQYSENSYLKAITTVFQDYKVFAVSILENISCQEKGEAERAMVWLNKLNLNYLNKKYPSGLDTVLNKGYEDEGIGLSGGEKQKIAIARALYKDGGLFILDEPTSSLDPKAEAEIYEKFRDLTGEKMTIYISHRMSSSIFCDRILVIDGGKIIDFGRHSELMKKGEGLYYSMFMAQAENYRV